MSVRLTRDIRIGILVIAVLGAVFYVEYVPTNEPPLTAEEELRLGWENENCEPIYHQDDNGAHNFVGMKCPPGGPPDPWAGTGKKHPPPSAD